MFLQIVPDRFKHILFRGGYRGTNTPPNPCTVATLVSSPWARDTVSLEQQQQSKLGSTIFRVGVCACYALEGQRLIVPMAMGLRNSIIW